MKKYLLSLLAFCLVISQTSFAKTIDDEIIRLESPKTVSNTDLSALKLNVRSIVKDFAVLKFGNSSFTVTKVEEYYRHNNSVLLNIVLTDNQGQTTNMFYGKNLTMKNNKLQLSNQNMKYYCSGTKCCTTNVTMNDDGSISYTCGCDDCEGHLEL